MRSSSKGPPSKFYDERDILQFRVVTAKLQGKPKCVGAFSAYAQVRVARGP